ncbi:hypothetical protein ACFL08_01415 [Patescibacteria group bacterium]
MRDVIVFHTRYGDKTDMAGKVYQGSHRDELSDIMGGEVGFGFLNLSENWRKNPRGITQILIPEGTRCVVSLNGEDVPRLSTVCCSFEEQFTGNSSSDVRDRVGSVDFFTGKVNGTYFVCGNKREWSLNIAYAMGPIEELKSLFEKYDGLMGELVFRTDGVRFGKMLVDIE